MRIELIPTASNIIRRVTEQQVQRFRQILPMLKLVHKLLNINIVRSAYKVQRFRHLAHSLNCLCTKLRRCRRFRYVSHLHDLVFLFTSNLLATCLGARVISSVFRSRLCTAPSVIGDEADDWGRFSVSAYFGLLVLHHFASEFRILRWANAKVIGGTRRVDGFTGISFSSSSMALSIGGDGRVALNTATTVSGRF